MLGKKDSVAGNAGMEMASLDDAIKIFKAGRLREGMAILEGLVRDDPENVNVLYNLGMC